MGHVFHSRDIHQQEKLHSVGSRNHENQMKMVQLNSAGPEDVTKLETSHKPSASN